MSESRIHVMQLLLLVVVVVVISILGIFIPQYAHAPGTQPKTDTTTTLRYNDPEHIPPPSAEVIAQLEQSRGFQALISYTERGFEPGDVTLQKGDAVRFINNSDEALWVGEMTHGNTPESPNLLTCGDTAFNSCKALNPGEFWEYSFYTAGEFLFMNNRNTEQRGVIRVE